ncbi:hypothetical protein GQ44DRAFT_770438 [Phaeosphaeriaceae sp. PMI808]|nr:hypothetical protein GQ44DRAFT_770438 [Phaeosphaeriaceae sp. PMI808]
MTPAISERPQQDCLATTESEISTTAWPLIHLAVTCSEEAYSEVDGSSAQPYTALKRIKITQRNARLHGQVVVVAVSGTRGLKDWMVNLKNNASEPKGVLGEKRNLCHTGFLETVRLLINPLALSLSTVERGLTLLFTGHSAGAAIASLLYAHVGTTKTSPLAKVAERFQSIHCIVFGAPPISIAPLQKKDHKSYSFRGSFYLSLINDGDPITKADAGYITKKYGWLAPIRPHLYPMQESWRDRNMKPVATVIAKPANRLFQSLVDSTNASAGVLGETTMSYLFWLPQELRDQIYTYVLYDANGLLYKLGRDGIGRLCVRSLKLPSRKNILGWLRRASHGRTFARQRIHQREINQLKYVCRRLYNETKGLGVPRNLVILEDACSWNAIEQCTFLLCRWPMLRQVAIRCSSRMFTSEAGKSGLLAVVQYCRENADVSVRVHIPHWTQADPNFVLQGLSYLLTLRKDTRLIARLAQATSISYLSDSGMEPVTINAKMPDNLRWYPWDEKFDWLLLERNIRKHPWLRLPPAQAAVGGMEELSQGWFTYGL